MAAVSVAVAGRMLAQEFNRPGLGIVNNHNCVSASDGDLVEGIAHDAALWWVLFRR